MKVTKTSSKVRVSPKIAVAVVLVFASVALGGYLLNMAGAGGSDSDWTYVLGPDRCSSTLMNSLISSITSGADVKVLLVNQNFQQECTAVEVVGGSSSTSVGFRIVCYLSGQKTIQIGGPLMVENLSTISVSSEKPCEMKWSNFSDRMTTMGDHSFPTGIDRIVPIKWFVKK